MKSYLIEDTALFVPAENMLVNMNSHEKIMLSVTAARLLELLIVFRGQVVSRDEIFSEVFDRYGATSTNNNLNQYVLALRKHFSYLNIQNEIIETIPRVGFRVPEQVRIFTPPTPDTQITTLESNKVASSPSSPTVEKCPSLGLFEKYSLMLLAAILLWLGTYWFYATRHTVNLAAITAVPALKLENISSCETWLLSPGAKTAQTRDDIRQLIKRFSESKCTPGERSRFYFYLSNNPGDKSRKFTLFCDGDTQRPACFSHYESQDGVVHDF